MPQPIVVCPHCGGEVKIPRDLSAREVEVLEHVARGQTNQCIGRGMGISDQTVKNHLTSIYWKLGVPDRTAAVVMALRQGLLHL